MVKVLSQLTAVLTILSSTVVLADYGDLWITGSDLNKGTPVQGRLEFEGHDGVWGTVCDVGFTERAGNVACKQIGFVRAEKVLYRQFGNHSRLSMTICATECTGKESRLSQCQLKSCNDSSLYQIPCKKENIVGILCTNLSNSIPELNDEAGSGIGNVNENGNPIDDEGDDDFNVNNGDSNPGNVGNVGNVETVHVEDIDSNNNDQNPTLPISAMLSNSEEFRSDHSDSDDSISAGAITTIVISCFLIVVVILLIVGVVYWSYRQRRPTFVVAQDYPKILVAANYSTTTATSIPNSYMQSSRISPKGYEALPVTDYAPMQPVIKKPVY